MGIFDKVLKKIADRFPKFNNFLLMDYRRKQVDNCINFIDIVFQEAIKVIGQDIEYLGSRILPPEARVIFEISNNIVPSMVNIKKSELVLVEYLFRYGSMEFSTNLYLPYLYEDFVIINDTKYNLQFNITDKIFSCSNKTLTARVIRSPIRFRIQPHAINSAKTNEQYIFSLSLVDVHYQKRTRKMKKKIQKTIFHYLICRFGLERALMIFDINLSELEFIEHTSDFFMDYEYFNIYPKNKKSMMLKVSNSIMNNKTKKNVILTILYILSDFRNIKIEEILNPDPIKWKTMLGQLIEGTSITLAVALQKATKHLDSLESYLDFISQKRYESFGLKNIESIYDLFIYVFLNIETILHKFEPNDMFQKRIDTIEQILIDSIISNIYNRIYKKKNTASIQREDTIKGIFNIKARSIYSIYSGDNVRSNPACYNDNKLFNYYLKMNSPSSKQKSASGQITKRNKVTISKRNFHMSLALVESLLGYSSNNPQKSSSLNPFLDINDYGGFVVPKYYEHLKPYEKHLD
jgi:hypothetical protein